MRDSVVTLPNGIQLIGRDDRHNRKRHSLQELMVNIDKSKPIILLDHQPFTLKETEAADIDLQFRGHTHHGQTWPINWVTDYICKATVIANGETVTCMYLPDCLFGDHPSE